jgi:hypothetical protein
MMTACSSDGYGNNHSVRKRRKRTQRPSPAPREHTLNTSIRTLLATKMANAVCVTVPESRAWRGLASIFFHAVIRLLPAKGTPSLLRLDEKAHCEEIMYCVVIHADRVSSSIGGG